MYLGVQVRSDIVSSWPLMSTHDGSSSQGPVLHVLLHLFTQFPDNWSPEKCNIFWRSDGYPDIQKKHFLINLTNLHLIKVSCWKHLTNKCINMHSNNLSPPSPRASLVFLVRLVWRAFLDPRYSRASTKSLWWRNQAMFAQILWRR